MMSINIRKDDLMSRTLVIIKPQAVQRGLSGQIIARYESKGLQLAAAELRMASKTLLMNHYQEHQGKQFYNNLLESMQQGPVIVMIFEGPEAVTAARMLNGATDPIKALPGTIRGDYGLTMENNVVHASDSIQNAEREISIWFPKLAGTQ